MLDRLKRRLRTEQFEPGPLSIVVNPVYFARRGLFSHIVDLAHYVQGKTLDVGCGSKPYCHLFPCSSYIGLDTHQSGHDHSQEEVDVFYDGVTIPFPDEHFDSVVSFQVLEHVFEPDTMVREMYRVLKKGGHLLLSVPFIWYEHEQPFDYGRYSSHGLKHLLEKHDFLVLEHRKGVTGAAVIAQLANALIYQNTTLKHQGWAFWLRTAMTTSVNVCGVLASRLGLLQDDSLYLDNIVVAQKKERP